MKTLFFLSCIFLSACFQSSSFDTCDREKQKLVRVDGGEKCLAKCSDDRQCQKDDVCVKQVCAPPGSIITISIPPDRADMGASRRDVLADTISGDFGPQVSLEVAKAACQSLAARFVSCTQSQCIQGNVDETAIQSRFDSFIAQETCIASVRSGDGFHDTVLKVTQLPCEHALWRDLFCNSDFYSACPTCVPPTTVGEACTDDDSCSSGDFALSCVSQDQQPFFMGGYCFSGCADDGVDGPHLYDNFTQCGDANICILSDGKIGERSGTCLKGCQSHADCRLGYGCLPVSLGKRACLPLSECKECPGDENCCENRCGSEVGPEGKDILRCQFPCQSSRTIEICEGLGGICSIASDNQEYCVLK